MSVSLFIINWTLTEKVFSCLDENIWLFFPDSDKKRYLAYGKSIINVN